MTIFLAALMSGAMSAQVVSTQYFLDMSPTRHLINPAFEPTTDGYMLMAGLGNLNVSGSNNLFTMADFIMKNPETGKTQWLLGEGVDRTPFLRKLKSNTMNVYSEETTNILSFGWRGKKHEKNYFHFGLDVRANVHTALPEDLFRLALESGSVGQYDMRKLNARAEGFLELALGYQRHSSDMIQWGAKAKVLYGLAYANIKVNDLGLINNMDQLGLNATGKAQYAMMGVQELPSDLTNYNALLPDLKNTKVGDLIKPVGMGAAFDLGININVLPMLGINVSFTDMGFMRWNKGKEYDMGLHANWKAIEMKYGDYVDANGQWDGNKFNDKMKEIGQQIQDSLYTLGMGKQGFTSALSPKMHIGIDGKFVDNKVGVSLYSKTQLYNKRLMEELTIGVTARPCNWFNAAITYSLLNGQWSNLGAGLGLRLGPFQLTASMDYIPLVYAYKKDIKYALPYKTPGVNANLGLAIVWGWKKKAPKMEVIRTESISGAAYGADRKHTR